MTYVKIRLRGLMQSYGVASTDDTRKTLHFPTKSAITGMVMNAIGLRFTSDSAWNPREHPLSGAVVDGATHVLVLDPGEKMIDFQSAGVRQAWLSHGSAGSPPADRVRYQTGSKEGKNTVPVFFRPAEREMTAVALLTGNGFVGPRDSNYCFHDCANKKGEAPDYRVHGTARTMLSEKQYLVNADFLVIQEVRDYDAAAMIAAALNSPRLPICLGRQNCPAYPVNAELTDMSLMQLTEAFSPESTVFEGDKTAHEVYDLQDIPLCLNPTNRKYATRIVGRRYLV